MSSGHIPFLRQLGPTKWSPVLDTVQALLMMAGVWTASQSGPPKGAE